MDVSIQQQKGNKSKGNQLKSSAIGKNPWDYQIVTPQRFIRSSPQLNPLWNFS
jgi:hypothetical protein